MNDPEVTDQAIHYAFDINNMISGGKTFQDIFTDIRELLFEEKRELILVEDLHSYGIQKELLPFFTQDVEKEEKLCVVRSMIAVTPDFLQEHIPVNFKGLMELEKYG